MTDSTSLFDAHVHLADRSLENALKEIRSSYTEINLGHAIAVGTSPEDWPEVIALSKEDSRFIPAIGLHPWEVNHAPENWRDEFSKAMEDDIRVIGEIGLDQWIEDHDIGRQLEAFKWQFAIAAERNLPTSIHCLKAHEPLLQTLRSVEIPERGFKLHAYNGPTDTLQPLLELGAYFSVNGGQLKPNAKKIRELIKTVPEDRLLMETDAPNFPPPDDLREFDLENPELCHPANLRKGYQAVAEIRGCSIEELCPQIAENFKRYFLR